MKLTASLTEIGKMKIEKQLKTVAEIVEDPRSSGTQKQSVKSQLRLKSFQPDSVGGLSVDVGGVVNLSLAKLWDSNPFLFDLHYSGIARPH